MNEKYIINKNNVQDILALTPLQEGMLFHYLSDAESNQYFEQLSITLTGIIDIEAFKKAWHFVTETNEMLRTVFRWDKVEKPVQIVLKEHQIPIKQYDFSNSNDAEKAELISAFREKDRKKNIDIGSEPLRVALCKLQEDKYEMIISNHHILYDGWSNGIILKEWFETYNNLCDGKEPKIVKKNKFKEFFKWQRKKDKSKQEEYWRKYLSGFNAKTSLSGDYKKVRKISETKVYSHILPNEWVQRIKKFTEVHKVTMAALLYSTWGVLLQRYNNTDDVIFGTTVSGRTANINGIEEIVGLFINTVPFRININSEEPVGVLLDRAANTLREREEYEDTPLLDIKAYSEIDRSAELFDSIVVIENYPLDRDLNRIFGKLKADSYTIFETTNYDMTFGIKLFDGIELNFIYNRNIFEAKTIERICGHFITILENMTESADTKVSKIEMLTDTEKKQLLIEFNDTYAEYQRDRAIHELFEEQAARVPDNIAVVCGDSKLTYNELNEKANRLARLLREKGAAPDSIVGIMAERSLELIIGIMGILKAGGAYLPINPEYPSDRIRFMLEDSGTRVLLTQRHFSDTVDFSGEMLVLEDNDTYKAGYIDHQNVNKACNRAYIIYTSGSTGRPKGVAVSHRALNNFLCSLYRHYEGKVTTGDNCLSLTNISFDVSVGEIFLPLINGARLVLLKNKAINDIYEIAGTLLEENITFAYIPPAILSQVCDLLTESGKNVSLNKLFVGVEPIKDYILHKYLKLNRKMQIVNGYGPTEATICATMFKLRNEIPGGRNVPIGKPVNNARICMLDSNKHLVPVGIAGELCISGELLAEGYINRPELTAEKFIPNPFFSGERMYKTGDLARWLPDGNIEFLGRTDHQIKLRGYRIELGEVENQILKYPDIKETTVTARADQTGDKYLCAYIVGDRQLTVTELREFLKIELPDYMIPSHFVQLPKIPLTPNGKIDRKALPEPDGSMITGVEYEAPGNDIEKKLVKIWEEVLGAEKIGINDNFFDLGGHSLKAISMVSKIHKELNVEIPLKDIFSTPTIKGIAEYIEVQEKKLFAAIEPIEERPYYGLSSAQKRLFTLQQFDKESIGYNISGAMEIEGKLDVERLKAAFRKLIKRHEALRTSFELLGEEVVQKVHKEVEFEIEHKEAENAEEIVRSFIRPFDLSKAPLLRVGIIKVHPEKHILMCDMHHIISDGASMGILTDEFVKLYEGQKLPDLRLQYKDYAAWQNGMVNSEIIKKQEEYWLGAFHGEIPVLCLPTDKKRPAIQGFEGNRIRFELDSEITKGIRKIAKETVSTMYMVLLSGLNILLYKYSGQEDMVVGSPIAGRNHADLYNIMGMFVNTLAMRNYPEGKKTFREFLEEVKKNALRAFENQDYQFEELVEKLKVNRDMSRNPLFDVMFALQNMDIEKLAIGELTIREYELKRYTSKFDITLSALEKHDGIEIEIEYGTSLFKEETIRRMAGHYRKILETAVYNPEVTLSEINMLSGEEKYRLIEEYNRTKEEEFDVEGIHVLFEEQAERNPDSTAVIFEDRRLTYRELNESANKLARALRARNIGENSVVGIMTERSPEMIIGIMGILKAGGAYLPIDPNYPKERIEYLLENSSTDIILTAKDNKYSLNKGEPVSVNEVLGQAEWSAENLGLHYDTKRLIYVLYTSGSTGKPKGVMVKMNSFLNLLKWYTETFEIGEKDNILLIASVSFDLAQKNLYASLIKGGKLTLAGAGMLDYREITGLAEDKQVTVINCTPSAFNPLVDMNKDTGYEKLASLRRVFLGGEPINLRKLEPWLKASTCSCEIINTYGPTECTDIAAYYRVKREEIDSLASVPIGRPIYNTRLYVLDRDMGILPEGIAGELYIGGLGVSQGYYNDPEMTKERFVSCKNIPEAIIYKTGDLVKWLLGGELEFLGRTDNQVKIRGFRIELGEIEARLLKHEDVKEALVTAKEDNNGNKYLCAYVVCRGDNKVQELREYAGEKLPGYMIPQYFVKLEKMPLTPNGKIDRKALPEPEGNADLGVLYIAPGNETEEKLAEIWKEVLGTGKIGINDNFFDLGGHSLNATSLVAKIHKKLKVEIPLWKVFQTPTIKELSKYIMETEEKNYVEIEPAEQKDCYELSSVQRRIYTLQQFEPGGIGYNIPGTLAVEGNLEPDKLEAAFRKLIERHESLRTFFELEGEKIVQKIQKELDFKITYKEEREEKTDKIIRDFIQVFDLSKAPLLRVMLIKLRPEKYILLYDMHHIISDGFSMGILVKEFVQLYGNKELPRLKVQYKDYAVWQNRMMKSEKIKKQEVYWLKQFEGEIPVLNLPADYIRPVEQSFEGNNLYLRIDKKTTEGLRRITNEIGATMYMFLLAAFNILLSKYSGQEDIIVGSPIAGRSHADTENIIGMFVNTLAMRNNLEGKKTFREFLEEVKENALRAYENQDYQFEELVEKLNIKRDMSRNPLFDVMFVLQNMEIGELNIGNLQFEEYRTNYGISKFDITLYVIEQQSEIMLTFEYSTSLFKEETIRRMAGHYRRILETAVYNPEVTLSEINMLSGEEKYRLIEEYNRTKEDELNVEGIHVLFEEQAERNPDSTAVIFEDRRLTYRELNESANKLARALRARNIGENSVVGIMTERSPEMIIGIMGILKAGGAYLPIDPNYPEERIEYLLENSSTDIILTAKDNKYSLNKGEPVSVNEVLGQTEWSAENLGLHYDTGRLIYVLYTSGSTGKPKGVMVKMNSFLNLLKWYTETFEIGEKDNILLIASVSFDLAQKNLYASLIKGGKLTLAGAGMLDYREINGLIEDKQVTVINCTPSAFNPLVDMNKDTGFEKLASLRRVFLGGEPINLRKLEPWLKAGTCSCEIINTYGPTECTDIAAYYRVKREEIDSLASVPIGRPIYNTRLYVLDRDMGILPEGIAGELYIGGLGVSRGYYNDPEMTKERFVSCENIPEAIIYKTGDLVKWLPGGELEFLGRTDNQVKIRGFRIELGEIEARLLKHEDVKEALVTAKEDNNGNKYLCAYVVCRRDIKVQELREYAGEKLPGYMIPQYFIKLEKMPLTPNGKIDRKALPEPEGNADLGVLYIAPRNETEEQLTEIWKEILGTGKIGIKDNFFALGGHSLNAMVLMAKISKAFGVNVPLKAIFMSPTIIEFAECINYYSQAVTPIKKLEHIKRSYPASSSQKKMYMLGEMSGTTYNMTRYVVMRGNLDIEKLKYAFNEIIKRHEILRTTFEIYDSEIVQIIHDDIKPYVLCYKCAKENIDKAVRAFIRRFDFKSAPLMRVEILEIEEKEHLLLMDIHHIISDGISMEILLKELAELYNGNILDELTLQYKDYSEWHNKLLESQRIREQEEYWLDKLKNFAYTELPRKHMPNYKSFKGVNIHKEIDGRVFNDINKFCKKHEVTKFIFMLTVFKIALLMEIGGRDVNVGIPVSGREHPGTENIMGVFINTLIINSRIEDGMTFTDYLNTIRDTTLEGYKNQDYPYEELYLNIKKLTGFSGSSLFSILFNYMPYQEYQMNIKNRLKGIEMIPYDNGEIVCNHDLTLYMKEAKDSIVLNLVYRNGLLEDFLIRRIADNINKISEIVLEDENILLSAINVCDEAVENKAFIDFDDFFDNEEFE